MSLKFNSKKLATFSLIAAITVPCAVASNPFGDPFFSDAKFRNLQQGMKDSLDKLRSTNGAVLTFKVENSSFKQGLFSSKNHHFGIEGRGVVGPDGIVRGTINDQPFEGTVQEFMSVKDTGIIPQPKVKAPAPAAKPAPAPAQPQFRAPAPQPTPAQPQFRAPAPQPANPAPNAQASNAAQQPAAKPSGEFGRSF